METLTKITNVVKTTLNTGQVVAGGYGGSTQLDLVDKASDLDVILLTINRPAEDINNQLQFYDSSTDKLVDCLIRDIDTLTKIDRNWLYGWGSWCWYLTALWYLDQSYLIIEDERVIKSLEVAYNNRNIFIYLLLNGYKNIITTVNKASTFPVLNATDTKSIYHICFIYNKEVSNEFSKQLLLKIKRNSYNQISLDEFNLIKKAISSLLNTYDTINLLKVYPIVNNLEKEINQIWK